jgi:hypothetical protein
MSLEQRYKDADKTSYVGRVRDLQAADAGAGRGVNFLDGDGVGKWTPGRTDSPDTFQKGFTRESEGTYRYGTNKSPAATNDKSYPLSGWLDKSLKMAFEGVGPAARPKGLWLDNRLTTLKDVRNGDTKLHTYAPLKDKAFSDVLGEMAKGRVNGSASGPSPAGLNG